ncbi:hypothetical protein CSW64_02425 [Caulobacter mirabilis]|uniref:Uncharacterized protein n=1 Tax=Caulobacter mirabilis TaxID=69666 RepID=A0A2D2ATL1_9CAUL|nr:hypothetical protein CSW64_02425 [Caulobacter mirabilis]
MRLITRHQDNEDERSPDATEGEVIAYSTTTSFTVRGRGERYRAGGVVYHAPDPLDEGGRVRYGQGLYRQFASHLKYASEKADLLDPQEFHALFWMGGRMLQNLDEIAREQRVSMATVNRWMNGLITPPAHRRRGCLASMVAAIEQEMHGETPPPPLREYTRRGAAPKRPKRLG